MNLPTKTYIVVFTVSSLMVMAPLRALGVTSAITKVVFITDARTVAPNTVSDVLTVQTQNSNSEVEKIEETADITFTSSSPSGEFLNSGGSPVSTVMSSGSANRNFYYRDSREGTHTLTVTVRARLSAQAWTVTQQVTIGSSTENTTGGAVESNPASSSSASSISTHIGAQELSEEELIILSTVGIGRDRVIPINTPIQFDLKGAPARGLYEWSFGDGSAGAGQSVRHVYGEVGDYVVVLNGNVQGKKIVARATVRVHEPSLVVLPARSPNALVIKNTGSTELNIGEWVLESGGVKRSIPRDTILLPKGQITVGIPSLTHNTYPIALYYPNQVLIAHYNPDAWGEIFSAIHTYASTVRPSPPQIISSAPVSAIPTPTDLGSLPSSSPSTIVLPLRRSWWQLFTDTVFAR